MKVFLSSTAQDLVAYRKVADATILRLSQGCASIATSAKKYQAGTDAPGRVRKCSPA